MIYNCLQVNKYRIRGYTVSWLGSNQSKTLKDKTRWGNTNALISY